MSERGEILAPVSYALEWHEGIEGWALYRFICDTQLNGLYRCELTLVGETPELELESLLGQRLVVHRIREGQEHSVAGLVTEVESLGLQGGHPVIRVIVEPAFALLDRGQDARIFQSKSAQEILGTCLRGPLQHLGSDLCLGGCARGQEVQRYCVQYQESLCAFAQRVMQENGINFLLSYDPERKVEVLRLFEDVDLLKEAQNVDGRSVFPMGEDAAHLLGVECIERLGCIHRRIGTRAQQMHWDWSTATHKACGQAKLVRSEPMHHFEAQQDPRGAKALDAALSGRKNARLHQACIARGTSQALGLDLGLRFTVEGHLDGQMDGGYLIVGIRHEGRCPDVLPGYGISDGRSETTRDYENRFRAQRLPTVLYPQARRPKPRVLGPQTAIVCGPTPGEVHTDAHGRVRLRFHWDRYTDPGKPGSCWVRVSQVWAGQGWGSCFLPRVGSEVVVEFLDGDPEQPLVTGAVHNASQVPFYELPHNHHQSGFRSRSSDGGHGYNELRFDDLRGAEEMLLRAQRKLRVEVGQDKQERVKGQVSQVVEGAHVQAIAGARCVHVQDRQEVRVQGPAAWTYEDCVTHMVGAGGWVNEVVGDLRSQSEGKIANLAARGFEVHSKKGGARFKLRKEFEVKAQALELVCGKTRICIDGSGAVTIQAAHEVVSIQGSKIRLNSV